MQIKEIAVLPKTGLFAFLTVLLIFVIGYIDTLIVLFKFWAGIQTTIYRFGFLVFACFLYLLYLKREQIRNSEFSSNYWAMLPTAFLVLAWFVASQAGVQTVQLAVIPFLLLSAVTTVLGTKVLKHVFLPVLVLLFAIPIWWPLVPYLRDATTVVTELGLRAFGTTVFVQDYYLYLASGTFFVDEGCSGLRFFLVTLILCFMSVDLFALSLRQSILLLSVSVALGLIANWVRVIIVVLIGDYTRMEHPWVSDHNNLGWVVFGIVVLLPFLLLVRHFDTPVTESEEVKEGAILKESGHTSSSITPAAPKSLMKAIILTCLILLTAPAASLVLEFGEFSDRLISTPNSAGPWDRLENRLPSNTSLWQPAYVDFTKHLYSHYANGSDSVHLHIINYAHQIEGSELINVDNKMAADDSWSIIPGSEDRTIVELDSGISAGVNFLQVSSRQAGRSLIWYWYEVGPYRTNNNNTAKLFQLLSLLSGRDDANLVSISVNCSADCLDDTKVVKQFLSQYYLAIRDNL